MASQTENDSDEAKEPEVEETNKTRSSQGSNAPDTTRGQQAAHDASQVHQPVFRLFTLPPEIRAMIFGFACIETPAITLPITRPTGMISIMGVLKDPYLRAEVVDAVWQDCSIRWRGSLSSKTWQRFKKTAMPRIRSLTIEFDLTDQTWFDLDSDIRRTLAWMWNRTKHGKRAGCPWSMKQLQIRGVISNPPKLFLHDSKWYFGDVPPQRGSMHWSHDYSFERLRSLGITVSVEAAFPVSWGAWMSAPETGRVY